jgi:hypothetical protein
MTLLPAWPTRLPTTVYKAIDLNKVNWAGMKGSVQHSYMVLAEDPWFRDYR